MKLHFNPASPYVRIVCATAHELGVQDQIERVPTGPFSPAEVHAAVAADNPLGKIPTLVTDHGTALYDSRVICEYLTHHAGDKRLLPDEPVNRFHVLILQSLAIGVCDAGVSMRYETGMRPEALRWDAWIARQTARIDASLDELEQNWLGELEAVTLGSIAAACAIGYLEFRDLAGDWRPRRSGLADFYDTFCDRPSMQATAHASP